MSTSAASLWENRIVKHAQVDPRSLVPNPQNARRHPQAQDDALTGSLTELGWIDEVTVNETTGNLVDGHERVELAIARGVERIPVRYVRLNEDQERKALLYKDPIAALATYDADALAALIAQVSTEDAGLNALLASLADDAALAQFDAPPTVLDPQDTGAYDERDFWPKLTFPLPRDVLAAWDAAVGDDEPHVLLARLLGVALDA